MDLDERYPPSSHEMPANSRSLPIIEDANDTSSIFQYIDLPHNTRAQGLEEFYLHVGRKIIMLFKFCKSSHYQALKTADSLD